jgi:site-specific DNA recombinase
MRKYFGYIRVSTHKQGEGCSLDEQKIAIANYAARHGLAISAWYEEQETAAKLGRKLFRQMLNRLHKGDAHGLILHKIDRGARNLKDWAELAGLMDSGVDVHFAHESLDMSTRGGRLSADIQAVVAADYIRNLRDEVKKGMDGRLRQGLYPWAAPVGYINNGKGKAKTVDPIKGKLVHELFDLYASGDYSMQALRIYFKDKGLTSSTGSNLTLSSISNILSNPFYYGIISSRGRLFAGVHEPIISQSLFETCKLIRTGKGARALPRKATKRNYLYQRLLHCATCPYSLYPEIQKGHTYYRCHQEACKGTSVSEEQITKQVEATIRKWVFEPRFVVLLKAMCLKEVSKNTEPVSGKEKSLKLLQGQLEGKLERLTDAYLEGALLRSEYDDRKQKTLNELEELKNQSEQQAKESELKTERTKRFFKTLIGLGNFESLPSMEQKRKLVKILTSNFSVSQKNIDITWSSPYQALLDMTSICFGAPEHVTSRTEDFSMNILNHDMSTALQKLFLEILTFNQLDHMDFDEN